jgi:hypothetical protein
MEVEILVTAQQIFNNTMDLMDKRSNTGLIDAAKTARYTVRAPSIITIAQNILARDGDLYSTYEFYHNDFRNLLGLKLDLNENYLGNEKIFESPEVGSAYYFEVDGGVYDGYATIEDFTDIWNTIIIIGFDNVVGMTPFHGAIVPTAGATKTRIRFDGNTFYRIGNAAIFAEPFIATEIPVFKAWVEYTMPSDFKSVTQIVKKSPVQSYQKDSFYTWEGKDKLYIDYNYTGNVKVIYVPVPIVITSLTQNLQIDDTASTNCLTYFLAAHLLLMEDPEISSFFNQMYMEARKEMTRKQPSSVENIEDVLIGGEDLWQ